jgi:hypothetical protein
VELHWDVVYDRDATIHEGDFPLVAEGGEAVNRLGKRETDWGLKRELGNLLLDRTETTLD